MQVDISAYLNKSPEGISELHYIAKGIRSPALTHIST